MDGDGLPALRSRKLDSCGWRRSDQVRRRAYARPVSDETSLRDHAEAFAHAHAMPLGHEDLDRGDNERVVKGGADHARLRMHGVTVFPDPQAAFAEAMLLSALLQEEGCTLGATSRLGAAAATGPHQEVEGWRALLDVSLHRVGHEPYVAEWQEI